MYRRATLRFRSFAPHDPLTDDRFQPRRSLRLRICERRPLRANEIEIDRIAIRRQHRFDVDLILRAKGHHLGQN